MTRRGGPSWIGPLAGVTAITTIILAVALGAGSVRALRIVGAGIGLVALPLAFAPIFLLQRRGMPSEGKSYMHTTKLVDSGIYGVVRHPQYLAYILFMLTFALLAQRAIVIALAILAGGLLYLGAVIEERECAEKLGQPYLDYAARVPRFNLIAGVLQGLWRRG